MNLYRRFGKRLLDILVGGLLSVVTLPLQIVVAFFVRFKLGSPVLFQQQRPGRNAKPLTLRKFRTMTDERDATGGLLPDAERLTTLGEFLRSSSLDELPEFVSVVKGDMSLVGPRPLLPEYLPLYTPHQARRHEVRPGLTGLAQVTGRNATTWEQRLQLDVWYVDHVSLKLDLEILWRTVISVVRRQGIRHDNHGTMPAFKGTRIATADNGDVSQECRQPGG